MSSRIFLLLFFGAGAFFDWKNRRIPNWWVLAGAVAGLFTERLAFFTPLAVVTVLFFPLFLCRMIGAGDIKMMALMAGFLGTGDGSLALAAGFVLGGVYSLIKLLYRKDLRRRLAYFESYVWRLVHTRQITAYYMPDRDGYGITIPLTACLFAGMCAVVFWLRG